MDNLNDLAHNNKLTYDNSNSSWDLQTLIMAASNTEPHHHNHKHGHFEPEIALLDDNDDAEKNQPEVGAGAGDEEEELGAMKEMMYRMAAMQPVDIDPATIRRPKRRNVRISDDPQSVAARHRRERISDRIRILQRLVPGGTKMDTASMLDEAIRYVKFLKRQIRILQQQPNSNNNYYYNSNGNYNSGNYNYDSQLVGSHHQRLLGTSSSENNWPGFSAPNSYTY